MIMALLIVHASLALQDPGTGTPARAPVPTKRIVTNYPKPAALEQARQTVEPDPSDPVPTAVTPAPPVLTPGAAAASAAATTAPGAPTDAEMDAALNADADPNALRGAPSPSAPTMAPAVPATPIAAGAGLQFAPIFLMAMLVPTMIGAVFASTRRIAPGATTE